MPENLIEDGKVVGSASIAASNALTEIANIGSRTYIVETYSNGSSWYRVWSDGWCEQGGSEITAVSNKTITLLKTYKDVNYKVLTTGRGTANRTINVSSRTEQDFLVTCRNYTDAANASIYDWVAYGYIS